MIPFVFNGFVLFIFGVGRERIIQPSGLVHPYSNAKFAGVYSTSSADYGSMNDRTYGIVEGEEEGRCLSKQFGLATNLTGSLTCTPNQVLRENMPDLNAEPRQQHDAGDAGSEQLLESGHVECQAACGINLPNSAYLASLYS